jgi:Kef-type K+ transport system membrane component KefB
MGSHIKSIVENVRSFRAQPHAYGFGWPVTCTSKGGMARITPLIRRPLGVLAAIVCSAQAAAQPRTPITPGPDSVAVAVSALDSLYSRRDTAGLDSAIVALETDSSDVATLYRGIALAWSGESTRAIGVLEPLLERRNASFTRFHRRALLSTLTESYARTRRYDSLTTYYDLELRTLEASIDSAVRRERERALQPQPILEALTSPEPLPPPEPERIPKEIGFIGLLFALFLLPKILQRFRIPGAITSLCMGAGAAALGWLSHDPTVNLLSTLGIVTLFLFAGLEIDADELKQNARPLALHAAIWTGLAIITTVVVSMALGTALRMSALLALALVTPSTGFILSTLKSLGLTPREQVTVRTYAIGSELIALAALFFILQSTSAQQLLIAVTAMLAIVFVIPVTFRLFASVVAPYAPRSEFAFLVMVAVVCAYATRVLGVYYLVGAFLVGVAAQRFRAHHPAMSSEKMIDALESFGSVFIPFYFFHAGLGIAAEHLSARAIAIGLLLVGLLVPVRVVVTFLHRRIALGEGFGDSHRVGSAMIPTLVFTLVIVSILEARFGLERGIAGALILYAIVNTTLPGFILRSRPPDFEEVEALPHKG